MTITPAVASVMAHVLTAVDPAGDLDQRDEAVDSALKVCPELTASVAVTYLRVVLDGYARQFGAGAAAHVISQLTAQSIGMLDPAGRGDD